MLYRTSISTSGTELPKNSVWKCRTWSAIPYGFVLVQSQRWNWQTAKLKCQIMSLFECELQWVSSSSVTFRLLLLVYFNSDYGLVSLHKSETMKWLCCILYLPSSHDSSRTITMNVAHKALQNNWIYLIFFSVVSQLKVIVDGVVHEWFSISYYLFFFSQLTISVTVCFMSVS